MAEAAACAPKMAAPAPVAAPVGLPLVVVVAAAAVKLLRPVVAAVAAVAVKLPRPAVAAVAAVAVRASNRPMSPGVPSHEGGQWSEAAEGVAR